MEGMHSVTPLPPSRACTVVCVMAVGVRCVWFVPSSLLPLLLPGTTLASSDDSLASSPSSIHTHSTLCACGTVVMMVGVARAPSRRC